MSKDSSMSPEAVDQLVSRFGAGSRRQLLALEDVIEARFTSLIEDLLSEARLIAKEGPIDEKSLLVILGVPMVLQRGVQIYALLAADAAKGFPHGPDKLVRSSIANLLSVLEQTAEAQLRNGENP